MKTMRCVRPSFARVDYTREKDNEEEFGEKILTNIEKVIFQTFLRSWMNTTHN